MRMLILLWFVFVTIAVLLLAIWFVLKPTVAVEIPNERWNIMAIEARNEHSQLKADLGGLLIYRTTMEAHHIYWVEPAEWSELAFFKDYDPEQAWLEIPVDVVYVFDDEDRLITFGYFVPDTATKIE